MLSLIAALLLGSSALAQDSNGANEGLFRGSDRTPRSERAWTFDPYYESISNITVALVKGPLSTNHTVDVWGVGGLRAGFRYRQRDEPNLFGYTRIEGTLPISFLGSSLGADVRVGSFFGQDRPIYRITSGADLFANVFPLAGNLGVYQLPFGWGVDWRSEAWLKVTQDFWIGGHLVPGWVFTEARKITPLTTFNELSVGATLSYAGGPDLQLGYDYSIDAAGNTHRIVISVRAF